MTDTVTQVWWTPKLYGMDAAVRGYMETPDFILVWTNSMGELHDGQVRCWLANLATRSRWDCTTEQAHSIITEACSRHFNRTTPADLLALDVHMGKQRYLRYLNQTVRWLDFGLTVQSVAYRLAR